MKKSYQMIKNKGKWEMGRVNILLVLAMTFMSGCGTSARKTLFQTSTIDALLISVYDGDISCGRLLKHGDFGIGTFDRLDEEMVILEGTIYEVKGDGKVYKPGILAATAYRRIILLSLIYQIYRSIVLKVPCFPYLRLSVSHNRLKYGQKVCLNLTNWG
jgi:hypothetical protein